MKCGRIKCRIEANTHQNDIPAVTYLTVILFTKLILKLNL